VKFREVNSLGHFACYSCRRFVADSRNSTCVACARFMGRALRYHLTLAQRQASDQREVEYRHIQMGRLLALPAMRQDAHGLCWKWVAGFEGLYEVSDHGTVHSLWFRNGRTQNLRLQPKALGLYVRPDGYVTVALGRGSHHRVNRLVLEAFVGPAPTPEHEAAHWDGDKCNNRLENLRWVSPVENAADKERHGRVQRGPQHWTARRRHANTA
jgi:hypothetical protein